MQRTLAAVLFCCVAGAQDREQPDAAAAVWPVLAGLSVAAVAANMVNDPAQRGIEETQRGEFANALVDFETALRSNPESPEVYFRLGLLFGRMNDFPDAEAAFRRALQLRPDFAEAYYNLGLTAIANPQNKLDWPTAISSFRKALQYRPDYAEAANYLGAGLMATGNVDDALPQFERAVKIKPALAEAHFNLGLAYDSEGRMEEAERAYRAALHSRPKYPEAHTALARLLLRRRQFDGAEREARGALNLNPDSGDAHYVLAEIERAEKMAGAGLEFQQVSEVSKRKADAVESARVTNEGLQFAAKGDFVSALSSERRAVTLQPDFGIAHYNLALILADTGDWSRAAREFVNAASLLPGNAGPWFGLGRVLRRKGDRNGAALALVWAKRLAPDDGRIQAELHSLLAGENSGHELPEMRHPPFGPLADTAAAHFAFASDLIGSEDVSSAVGELLRGLSLEPANEQARRQLARAYRRLKMNHEAELEDAKADLVRAASGSPVDSEP